MSLGHRKAKRNKSFLPCLECRHMRAGTVQFRMRSKEYFYLRKVPVTSFSILFTTYKFELTSMPSGNTQYGSTLGVATWQIFLLQARPHLAVAQGSGLVKRHQSPSLTFGKNEREYKKPFKKNEHLQKDAPDSCNVIGCLKLLCVAPSTKYMHWSPKI